MKILHLDTKNKWVPVEKRYYDDEAHLQNLLTDDINTLPLEEIGYDTRFVTIGKEVGLQNGALDVLAVSPQGHIALIETKLDKNPEVKRTVVGQILGYASYLWNQSYEDLENNCFKKFIAQRKINFTESLFEYIKEKTGDEDLSELEFKEGIEKRLRLGSFSLLIVVDQVNKELRDIANYLNDRTGQEIDFYVIEMELVGDKQEQFLIPRLSNPPRKNVTYSSDKTKVSDSYDRTPVAQDDFLSKLQKSDLNLAKQLLALDNKNGIKVIWRKNGFSLSSKLPMGIITPGVQNNLSYLFFEARDNYSTARLQFGYADWHYDNKSTAPIVKDYIEHFRAIKGYDDDKKMIPDLSVFDQKSTDEFISAIKQIAKKIDLL